MDATLGIRCYILCGILGCIDSQSLAICGIYLAANSLARALLDLLVSARKLPVHAHDINPHTHRHNPFPSSAYHDLPRSKRWATIRHQRNHRRRAPRSTPSSVACVTFSIVVHPPCDCLHSTFCICFYCCQIMSFHRALQNGRVRGV